MQTEHQEFENGKNNARNFGGTVYVGGVVAATALFITFVLTAFPTDAYLTKVIMTSAGLAVGCSMLAFPYSLHNWIVEKKHRAIATWLYYGEMGVVAINTIVSFVTLLANATGYTAPQWAILYEPFSILSIVYVIFAWGTIFRFDPDAETKQRDHEYQVKRRNLIATTKLLYLSAPEGQADIAAAAQAEILADQESTQNKPFFAERRAQERIPAPAPFVKKEATTEETGGQFFRPE